MGYIRLVYGIYGFFTTRDLFVLKKAPGAAARDPAP
jgi:hypothetical protein